MERLCAQCGSVDLEPYMGQVMGWQFKCRSCGFVGIPLEGFSRFQEMVGKKNDEK
ncbi:MAG: hypothetical protein HY917_00655 [Candidatus Diapherotrites archaeon]|nr:hypothetical protein [Candidatus Diapherotrites archaeon]